MSADSPLTRLRLPLAAFVAAAMLGVGLGLALAGGDDAPPSTRAVLAAPVEAEVAVREMPEVPRLRLGEVRSAGPSAPVAAAPATATPQPQASELPQVQSQTPQPQTPAPAQPSQPSGPQLGVQEESVASP